MLGKKKKEPTGTEIVKGVQTSQQKGTRTSARKRADELAAVAKHINQKPAPSKTEM
jgi:hypothetical protein